MKVYLLTSGDYSDYKVHGVFSSMENFEKGLEKLEAGIPSYARGEFNDPDEREIDEILEYERGPVFRVMIFLSDGLIRGTPGHWIDFRDPAACEIFEDEAYREEPRDVAMPVICVTSPVSREHAIKVAVEKRQEWLRTQELQRSGLSSQ